MPRASSSTPDSDFIVDDTRTDLIKYHSPDPDAPNAWFHILPFPGSPSFVFYNSTYSFTSNGTSFDFTFTGTQVAVYGAIAPATSPKKSDYVPTVSAYSINGTHNATFTTSYSTTNQLQALYYQSDPLPYDTYTLHVDALSGLDYTIDWIEYNVTSPETTPSSSASSTGATPAPFPTASLTSLTTTTSGAGSLSSSSTTSTASSTPASASLSSDNSSVDVGAAVGGSIGGFVVLCLGALAAYLFWRRRRAGADVDKGLNGLTHGSKDQLPAPYSFPPALPPVAEKSAV